MGTPQFRYEAYCDNCNDTLSEPTDYFEAKRIANSHAHDATGIRPPTQETPQSHGQVH